MQSTFHSSSDLVSSSLRPLLAFQVFTEAFVLGRIWNRRAKDLWLFAFIANCWSLAAGIPVKITNSLLYGAILPNDLPSYFGAYPFAVALGSVIYFIATLAVEGLYARYWNAKRDRSIFEGPLWKGILSANLATYIVLAPLHYMLTRPVHHVAEFTHNAAWSTQPKLKVVVIDPKTGHLRFTSIDGSDQDVIVSSPVRDYVVSSNLNFCLYRGSDNNLHFQSRTPAKSVVVWETTERFRMDQVAFSPSGQRVAFVSEEQNAIEVLNLETNKRTREALTGKTHGLSWPSVAWSNDDTIFYFKPNDSSPVYVVTIARDDGLQLQTITGTTDSQLLTAFGRVSTRGGWGSYRDWGQSFDDDECDGMQAWCVPGLGSSLKIYETNAPRKTVFDLRVDPGLLHISGFRFGDVAFLPGCRECLFDTEGYIYLLDIHSKRIATIIAGERFALLTSRYQKRL